MSSGLRDTREFLAGLVAMMVVLFVEDCCGGEKVLEGRGREELEK